MANIGPGLIALIHSQLLWIGCETLRWLSDIHVLYSTMSSLCLLDA